MYKQSSVFVLVSKVLKDFEIPTQKHCPSVKDADTLTLAKRPKLDL